jgi:hypothetical protein
LSKHKFAAQEEQRGIGPVNDKRFDAALKRVATTSKAVAADLAA